VQLGRNAQSIYQDLVETCGFTHRYNSVKRFVRTLKARDPERYDVLEYPAGEEAQVDFGQGAPTLYRNGKYRRPWLFVMICGQPPIITKKESLRRVLPTAIVPYSPQSTCAASPLAKSSFKNALCFGGRMRRT